MLIEELQNKGVLKTKKIKEALFSVDRRDFVFPAWKDYAYADTALPTMEGQTISQPYTVVFMLEKLSPLSGDVVIDIGAGSGWQTALLASIVGEKGKVYAYEINPSLLQFAQNNLKKYPHLLKRVEWKSDGKTSPGCKFNHLIAAASVEGDVPLFWREDLLSGGRLVYPSRQSIIVEKKDGYKEEFPGFVFVPFR